MRDLLAIFPRLAELSASLPEKVRCWLRCSTKPKEPRPSKFFSIRSWLYHSHGFNFQVIQSTVHSLLLNLSAREGKFLDFLNARRDCGTIWKKRKENIENNEHLVPRPFTSNNKEQIDRPPQLEEKMESGIRSLLTRNEFLSRRSTSLITAMSEHHSCQRCHLRCLQQDWFSLHGYRYYQ